MSQDVLSFGISLVLMASRRKKDAATVLKIQLLVRPPMLGTVDGSVRSYASDSCGDLGGFR